MRAVSSNDRTHIARATALSRLQPLDQAYSEQRGDAPPSGRLMNMPDGLGVPRLRARQITPRSCPVHKRPRWSASSCRRRSLASACVDATPSCLRRSQRSRAGRRRRRSDERFLRLNPGRPRATPPRCDLAWARCIDDLPHLRWTAHSAPTPVLVIRIRCAVVPPLSSSQLLRDDRPEAHPSGPVTAEWPPIRVRAASTDDGAANSEMRSPA